MSCAIIFRPVIFSLKRHLMLPSCYSVNKVHNYLYLPRKSCAHNLSVQELAHFAIDTTRREEGAREFTACKDENEDQELFTEYDPYFEKRQSKKRSVISTLENIFGIRYYAAKSMKAKYPVLKNVDFLNAQKTVKHLNQMGIPLHVIKNHPWLLGYKLEIIVSELELLKQLNLGDVCTVLPLVQVIVHHLQKHSLRRGQEIPYVNRIIYASEKLQCNLEDACKVFLEYSFLCSIPSKKFCDNMDILLDAGVPPEYILRDMWIFQYRSSEMIDRIKILKEVGINPIKPWMLRSAPEVFAVTIRRELSTKEVLGDSSVMDYLAQRLECDQKTVEVIVNKYPRIPRIRVTKLKELFDFLFAEGYTPQNILQVPRLFFHSIDTLKHRITELKEAGYKPVSLNVICKTSSEFEKIVENFVKRKYRRSD